MWRETTSYDMKSIKLFLGLAIFLLISCDDCRDIDCIPDATFRYIIHTTSNQNIYETNHDEYDPEEIRIIGFSNGIPIQNHGILTAKNIIVLDIYESTDSIIVQYNTNDYDKFVSKNLSHIDEECCGKTLDNFDLELNNIDFCTACNDQEWILER